MKLLAFDTSTAQGSVAVFDGETVLSNRKWQREKSHSELLTAEIETALKDSNIAIKEVDALAVGQGPGSFTGIRVAINGARSLAYVLKKPVYVFDTSELLVAPVTRFDLPVLTVINAQKNSYFVSRFRNESGDGFKRESELTIATHAELEELLTKPYLCLGDGAPLAETQLSPQARLGWVRDASLSDFPDAVNLGHLVATQGAKHPPLVWNAVQPLYIRASGAEEKRGDVR